MKWLSNIWKWFDKKKTVIGSTAMIVSEIIPEPTISGALKVVGMIFGFTGTVHKIAKKELKNAG